MKYFFDTEFIEGFHKPLFGKKRHFIDLISIGIVCEDGRTLSLISNEYNHDDADKWVQDNVILPLYKQTVHGDRRNFLDTNNFHKHYGVSNKAISNQIAAFFGCYKDLSGLIWRAPDNIEVYAYYADYDWVLFCSLFGRMISLPKGFPMYCNDLKQMLDTYVKNRWLPESKVYMAGSDVDVTFEVALEKLKALKEYPKQENEHSAIDDAQWNFKLYNFLQTL